MKLNVYLKGELIATLEMEKQDLDGASESYIAEGGATLWGATFEVYKENTTN
jgi:hypothetical protein